VKNIWHVLLADDSSSHKYYTIIFQQKMFKSFRPIRL